MVFKKKIAELAKSFRPANSGGVAIMFAGGAALLLGIAGGAVDVSRWLNVSSHLQAAADAAALAAARDPALSIGQAKKAGEALFQSVSKGPLTEATPNFQIDLTSKNGVVSEAKVTATIAMPTTLMAVVGIKSLPITVVARAGIPIMDSTIFAVLDMSASMGLAADAANRTRLEQITRASAAGAETCAFACHRLDSSVPAPKTTWQMARDNNILLREDVMAQAFGAFADKYLNPGDLSVAANRKKVSVIGFSDSAQMLQAATSSSAMVKAAPAAFPNSQRWNTKYDIVLPAVRAMVGAQGTGEVNNPKKGILLVTDGVRFAREPSPAGAALDTRLCDDIKRNGVPITVLEIKYLDSTGNWIFDDYVKPYFPQVSPALKACASPGLYFQATDSDVAGMTKAFNDVAGSLQNKLTLTQ